MDNPAKPEARNAEDEPGGIGLAALKDTWISQFKGSFKSIQDLSRVISFSEEEKDRLSLVADAYRMRITPYYLSLIKNPYDSNDPIRMQCVPSAEELK